MLRHLAIAGLVILSVSTFAQIDLNLISPVKALRSPIESVMARMYTDNPANETLQMTSPAISQDSIGGVHFVGEVINKGSEPARFVEIVATFYSSGNQVIGTKSTFTEPDTIVPGEAAPFELITGFGDTIQVAYIDHVKFHLDWRDSNHPF